MGYDFTDDEDDAWDDLSLCEWDYDDGEWTEADEKEACTRRSQAFWADFEHYGRISHWVKLADIVGAEIELLKPVTRFDDEIPF